MTGNELLPIMANSVSLRCFVPEDAAKILAMSQEPGMRLWLPDQVYATEADALEVLQYLIVKCQDPGTPVKGPYVLGVCLRDSGELIGHVGLSPLDGSVEIGYAIADNHQGKGYATQAVRAMSDWALARFAMPEIYGIVAVDNASSCRVLQNAGFALEDESLRSLHGQVRLVRKYRKALSDRDE